MVKASAKDAKTVTATFEKAKETPGTWQYKETSDDQFIGTLYLKRHAVKALGNPTEISVTVTFAK